MLKRIFGGSPLGIALSVAGVVLAVSPEARRAARRMLVKGTAAVMGGIEQVKKTTNEAVDQGQNFAERAGDAVGNTVEAGINTTQRIGERIGDAVQEGMERLDNMDLNPMDDDRAGEQIRH